MLLNVIFMVLAQATVEPVSPSASTVALAKDLAQLGVSGLLLIAVVVIWRVNTKLAEHNNKLHGRIAEIQEGRVTEEKSDTKAMTEALIASTNAGDKMATALANNNRLIERWLDDRDRAERTERRVAS